MKIKAYHILILIPFFINGQDSLAVLLKKHNTESIPYITSQELHTLDKNMIIFDAREKREYDVSHIKGAVHVGYNDFKIDSITQENIPKDTTIIVYCSLGIRSEDISEKLKKEGYKNIYNLYGGIFQWKNDDYTVVDAKEEITDTIHAYSKQWGKWLMKGIKTYTP